MTIALSVLITGFDDFVQAENVVSAADVGSDATNIVDAVLAIYGDGWFAGWWAYITAGVAEGDIRQIEGFDSATYTLTPYVDFSAAVANGDTYELHKNNPDYVIRALNDAFDSLFTQYRLYRKIVFESLGQDDLASNAASAQADVIITDDTLFFAGQTVMITDDNGSEDATIDSINATTNTLTMEDVLTNAYTTAASAKVVAKSGKYFNLGATIGNARVMGLYSRADSTSRRNRLNSFEIITSNAGDRQLYSPTAISVDDKTWIIEAIDRLEELEDPTDTITLEDRRAKLVYAEAAYHFFLRQSNDISAGDYERLAALSNRFRQQALTDFRNLQMPRPIEVADMNMYD